MGNSSPASTGNSPGQKPKENDYYPTPYSITRHLLTRVKFIGDVLEPAAGKGAIVAILESFFRDFDIEYFDKNFGKWKQDFLKLDATPDNIITNPPFSIADEFVLKAKEITSRKIALFMPLDYLTGKARYDSIYKDNEFPLRHIYGFVRKPHLGGPLRSDGKYGTGMRSYCWYVWERGYIEGSMPRYHFIDNDCDVLDKYDDPDQINMGDLLPYTGQKEFKIEQN